MSANGGQQQQQKSEQESSGSATVTVTAPDPASSSEVPQARVVLKKKNKPRGVQWDESTAIDNEHMNKKSSKVCCIYHKPKEFGESDSEDDCHHDKNAYDRQPKSVKK
eukprot:sb/3477548/